MEKLKSKVEKILPHSEYIMLNNYIKENYFNTPEFVIEYCGSIDIFLHKLINKKVVGAENFACYDKNLSAVKNIFPPNISKVVNLLLQKICDHNDSVIENAKLNKLLIFKKYSSNKKLKNYLLKPLEEMDFNDRFCAYTERRRKDTEILKDEQNKLFGDIEKKYLSSQKIKKVGNLITNIVYKTTTKIVAKSIIWGLSPQAGARTIGKKMDLPTINFFREEKFNKYLVGRIESYLNKVSKNFDIIGYSDESFLQDFCAALQSIIGRYNEYLKNLILLESLLTHNTKLKVKSCLKLLDVSNRIDSKIVDPMKIIVATKSCLDNLELSKYMANKESKVSESKLLSTLKNKGLLASFYLLRDKNITEIKDSIKVVSVIVNQLIKLKQLSNEQPSFSNSFDCIKGFDDLNNKLYFLYNIEERSTEFKPLIETVLEGMCRLFENCLHTISNDYAFAINHYLLSKYPRITTREKFKEYQRYDSIKISKIKVFEEHREKETTLVVSYLRKLLIRRILIRFAILTGLIVVSYFIRDSVY